MNLIRPIAWTDVWSLTHSLYARHDKLGKAENGVRRLPLIDDKWKSPALKEWRNMTTFLGKARRLLDGAMPQLEIARAEVEQLDPGATLPWLPGWDDEGQVHIGAVTNPAARLLAGLEAWSVGWGEVVLLTPGPRIKHAAVNFGETPRIHLILHLRQRPIDDGIEYQTNGEPT